MKDEAKSVESVKNADMRRLLIEVAERRIIIVPKKGEKKRVPYVVQRKHFDQTTLSF